MKEEVAPPKEHWPDHLRALDDSSLCELAKDYTWIAQQRLEQDSREDYDERREAIVAECDRRGLKDAANGCRRA